MKSDTFRMALSTMAFLFGVGLLGCALLGSPEAKVVERQILNDVQIACVLEHAMLQVPALETACAIEHDLAPAIETVLATKKVSAKMAANHSRPCLDCSDPWGDAGADASKDAAKDSK